MSTARDSRWLQWCPRLAVRIATLEELLVELALYPRLRNLRY
jgi:hypothetical protein